MADLVAGSLIYNFDVQGEEKLDAALANAKAETESFGSSLGNISFQNFSSDASQAFGNIADGIQSVITSAALLTIGGGALGSIFLNSAAGLQQTNIGFQSLIGNTQEANKLFGQLVQYANVTPFQAQDVTKAAQTLLGFGTSAQQT